MASIIVQMNRGAGPDLLGICEVENEFVVTRLKDAVNPALPARRYEVVHADTADERGIDIAFLYDPALVTALPKRAVPACGDAADATRGIFQVNFQTHRGRIWSIFSNHWPSRSGGQMESAE